MADGPSNIPAIVTTDLSSNLSLNKEVPIPSDGHEHDSRDAPYPDHPLYSSGQSPPSHMLSPQSQRGGPAFLSPFSQSPVAQGFGSGRMSLDVPRSYSPSPTFASSNEGSSLNVPPSPTLSTQSSVHFATSLSLRDNKPEDRNGYASLSLLSPVPSHRRKGSNATWASSFEAHSSTDETEPDHGGTDYGLVSLHRAKSDATSMTIASPSHTHVDLSSEPSKSHAAFGKSPSDSDDNVPTSSRRKPPSKDDASSNKPNGRSRTPDEESGGVTKIDLDQDATVDPGPFRFKPYQLASLLDPKSLEALEALGGISGLMSGLGTHGTRGLDTKSAVRSGDDTGRNPSDGRPGAGSGASQRHDRPASLSTESLPGIVAATPGDKGGSGGSGSGDDGAFAATLEDRKRVFGENVLPSRPSQSLLALMWLALKDKVLVLLSIAAVISLALGLFQDFGTQLPPGEPPVDWVEGVAIMIAILIVVVVGSLNDWQKERQFKALNEKKEERGVKVIRNGVEHVIDIKDVVVGDIALLEPGEIVPCDGVFLSGHNVKCDESGATGESDAIKKASYADCQALKYAQSGMHGQEGAAGGEAHHGSSHTDCFMVSGSKVLEGVGSYVVIAVGTKSFNGRIMMALRTDAENTPLQLKLNILAELIAKIGSIAGLILFGSLLIRFFVQLGTGIPERNANQKGMAFVQILIISVTLVVVAVPEGLPLAVTLALAFATKRMTSEKLLVRVLGSCETMANASVICTDKTGTLTQNVMSVVAGSVGIHAKFVRKLQDNQARTNADEVRGGKRDSDSPHRHRADFSIDQSQLDTVLSPQLRVLFNAAISVNSTAFEDDDPETGERTFVGSKTETALLKFAQELGWSDYKKTRDAADIIQMIPFSSERKAMGVVVRLGEGRFRLYVKGASEILTKLCTHNVVVNPDSVESGGEDQEVETAEIDEVSSENISRTIIFYANQTLRTIALCYRDFTSWPPAGVQTSEDEVAYDDIAQNLTLIGITGIEDPLREGVREAVADCTKAGVTVKMCTGDNVLTARSIASQCGIYTAGGIIMEGPVFRQLSERQMLEIVPRLQVLARSSPEDKKILVEKLKSLGEIVGVTGDGTNDGPALKTAHVGFSMGIAGTEVAKEASDIILMDDNFSSIVKAIMWGRCVNDAVRKFLQFQISTNVTAVVITFVSAVASASETSVLSAVQLLWINIIMDTFAALALATDPASPVLLDRKPDKQSAPLFTVDMYKQILLQSTYQIIVTLIFHFLGLQILGFEPTSGNDTIVQTLVFNAFVFAQIFNSVNSRRLDKKLNIFEGITRNYYFMAITLLEIAVQALIVSVGGAAFQVTRIGGREWGISLALGVVSIPLGALIRMLPNEPFEKLFVLLRLLPNHEVLPTIRPDAEWNEAIELVRDNLATFAGLRGGRIRSSSFVVKSRSARVHEERRAALPLPSIMTMVPSLIASSIGAGWAPHARGSLSDPARYDPSRSSAALWEGKFQIHPDTKPDDPLYRLRLWGDSKPTTPPV
ncbi:Ca-transporting ATPase [Leucogyrophana mollusca]|uniref:Ca-transporting ATPase n=1 Tax=Leucogyrophana mollusca TaxID=85980 RepID=A0ACB8B218_9AGAM|nr:Ca-transporting ATPase [Leucogyrophana mollusca]